MIDYQAIADAGGFGKGPRRDETKRTKQAQARTADKKLRDAAWTRCGGRCERCGGILKRTGDLLYGAQFNHIEGKRRPKYEVLCRKCHFSGPSGAHQRKPRVR